MQKLMPRLAAIDVSGNPGISAEASVRLGTALYVSFVRPHAPFVPTYSLICTVG